MFEKTIDWTRPVRTIRDKTPVEIITTKARGEYPVMGYVGNDKITQTWNIDGVYFCESQPHLYDLENAPEKIVAYVNFYGGKIYGGVYESKANAESLAGHDRIACIRVEYEDGQYDA